MSRIRANTITNQNANGAPNFPNGITVTGVVTTTTITQNITGDLTVSGNVGIGGTLTYEDVTNIDSVGVITARSGIQIGVGGTIGSSGGGIVTYFGDGAQLTGISVDPSATASSAGFLKVLNASTPQIRLSNNASDNDDQQRSFFAVATGNNNFIQGSVANDTVLRGRAGGDLLLGIGSTIRMRIDENGQVTKPAQVCFSGLNNSGSGNINAGSEMAFTYTTSGGYNFSNIGNPHNSSNGRFTAPVAGNYLCIFSNLVSDQRYAYFKVNGAFPGSSSSGSSSYTGAGGYNDLTACAIITLAANDYVQYVHTGSGSSYGNQHGGALFTLIS